VTSLLIPLVPQAAATVGAPRPPSDAPELSVSGPSLRSWSNAVSTSTDPALVLDPQGAVIAASAEGGRLLGRPVLDLLGRELHRAAGFVDFHASPRSLALDGSSLVPVQALRSNSLARGLMRVRLEDGRLITLDAIAAPLHDAKAQLVGALVLLTDVTPV
jgi:PAS domain-containing protein